MSDLSIEELVNKEIENKKSIKRGLLYNGFYQLLITLTPLITAPYISRTLGADGYGFFNYTVSIAFYFFTIAMLGVNTYGNREIAKVRDDKRKRSNTFWQIYYMQLFLGLLSTILYLLFVTFFIKEEKALFYLQGLYVFSTCTDINWYAFGMEEFKLMTIRNTVVKLVSMVFLFCFVKSPSDLAIYFLIYVFGVILGLLPIWPLVIRTTSFVKPKPEEIIKHFKPNFILFLPYVALSLYQQMDRLMIGAFVSKAEVGYYVYAESIIAVSLGLMTTITNVMLPRSSYLVGMGKKEESDKLFEITLKYTGIINIAICFGIIAVADVFIPWYLGRDFDYTATLLMILAPGVIVTGVGTIIRSQMLIPYGQEKEYTIAITCGTITNLVLNTLLIFWLHAIGACIATVLANLIVMLVEMYYTRDKYSYAQHLKEMMPHYLDGIIMLGILIVIKSRITGLGSFAEVIVIVGTGCVVFGIVEYIILIVIERDPVAAEFIERIIRKRIF